MKPFFFRFEKTFFRVYVLNFCHYFICHLWHTKFLITFLPIISRITMCNLHWCYTFCTGVKLFALVLYLNFTAVSQSELSNFLVYYYQSVRCIYTSLSIYFHPLLILTNVFFPNHFSGNSQFFEDCYYHSLRFSDSIEVGIAF